ncbi:hypothetical protein C7445_1074 [Alicyclobacillus sacchari]|uniref:Secreted protein n=1 Tax=Alicyclobacillus sacchari TaxID=392010 RepID=A0A4R8LLK5_9BACL|nr:hypothetical protein C7445_1074 [Alicyclobacillus sacchari]
MEIQIAFTRLIVCKRLTVLVCIPPASGPVFAVGYSFREKSFSFAGLQSQDHVKSGRSKTVPPCCFDTILAQQDVCIRSILTS